MGVNPGANAGTLVYLYGPIVLASLFVTGVVAVWLARRRFGARGAALLALAAQVVVVAALFLAEVNRTSSQRGDDRGVGEFLASYASRAIHGGFEPVRRRRH